MKKTKAGIIGSIICLLLGGTAEYWFWTVRTMEKAPSAVESSHAESSLEDPEECYLCGNNNRSVKGMFSRFEDLGVLCVNDWYVIDMRVRNHDDSGNLTGAQGHTNMTRGDLGKGKHSYQCNSDSDRGISDVTVYEGEDRGFDVKKVQSHLCRTCLEKVLAVMEVYAPEKEKVRPRDLCLVDFQTLELYSLQGDDIAFYVRDYYVQVDGSRPDEMHISAFYAPILENKITNPD